MTALPRSGIFTSNVVSRKIYYSFYKIHVSWINNNSSTSIRELLPDLPKSNIEIELIDVRTFLPAVCLGFLLACAGRKTDRKNNASYARIKLSEGRRKWALWFVATFEGRGTSDSGVSNFRQCGLRAARFVRQYYTRRRSKVRTNIYIYIYIYIYILMLFFVFPVVRNSARFLKCYSLPFRDRIVRFYRHQSCNVAFFRLVDLYCTRNIVTHFPYVYLIFHL